jgi:hypothetical protein
MCEKILEKKRKAYSYEVGFTANKLASQMRKIQLQYSSTGVIRVIGSRLSLHKNGAVGEEAGQ